MAVLESYSPCPCGSGQKYKWCCQKAEPYAQKSARLQDSGALDPAKAALDEGLAKFPDNPWLSLRKAVLLVRMQQMPAAAQVLRQLITKEPRHVGARSLLIRVVIETEGVSAASAELQSALNSIDTEQLGGLAPAIQAVGAAIAEEHHLPAAIAHFELADELAEDEFELPLTRPHLALLADPGTSPWLRNQYTLAPAPEGLPSDQAASFADALAWAQSGRWSAASAAFELLAGRGVAAADLNAGLCRLWLGEEPAAVSSLRRYIAQQGTSTEAVDLEALCQLIEPPHPSDLVAHVQLIWTARDREGLLKKLRADPTVSDEGAGPIDEDDPKSPQVQWFLLLDRPVSEDKTAISASQLPHIEARVLVGQEIVALDLIDDGRLERLRDRLTDLAGTCLPPAHPRTKTLGPVSRMKLALDSEIRVPSGLDAKQLIAIRNEEQERIFTTVWPDTQIAALGGRTPRKAAQAGNAEVPLRAMLVQFEFMVDAASQDGLTALRTSLNLPLEPAIDPETCDPETLHISRLSRLPVPQLSDVMLTTVYALARRYMLVSVLERTIAELISRPQIFERGELDAYHPYSDLANLELAKGAAKDAILEIVANGRNADKSKHTPLRWDFLDLRMRARTEPPQEWVPRLAVILETKDHDSETSSVLMMNLHEMGLIELTPNREEPGQTLIDTRRLQSVLAQFGPKITTASGRLGVSATQPTELWTPDKDTKAPSGIWTPGASAPPTGAGDKSKLIIPGRS